MSLYNYKVDDCVGLPHLYVRLVFRRVIARNGGSIIGKFYNDLACTGIALGDLALIGAH